MQITKCEYNWNDGTVDVFFSDGTKIAILCKAVKKELECSPEASDKLYDMAIEKPLEYAQMVLDGTQNERFFSNDKRLMDNHFFNFC